MGFLSMLFFLGTMSKSTPVAQADDALVEVSWEQDFESGTVQGWWSYPPFQDTAYDYSLLTGYERPPDSLMGYIASGEFFYPVGLKPPPTTNGNRFYCLRAYRPNSAAPQRIGLARKLSVYLRRDSELDFDCWLRQTASPVTLLVELAGSDGRRYRHEITVSEREKWLRYELPMLVFRCGNEIPRPGLEIEAVSLVACFDSGDPSVVHYFALDNIRLTGRRRARFHVLEPESRWYDQWPMAFSQKHFHPGDVLDLRVRPEVPVVSVRAALFGLRGEAVLRSVNLQKQGDSWYLKGFHRFSERDPYGPMNLEVIGETVEGTVVRSEVRLWFLKSPGNLHPRLFFSETDLETLRERARTGRGKKIWNRLVKQAASARKIPVPDDGQVGEFPRDYLIQQLMPYFDGVQKTAWRGMINAWVYALDGDEEAAEYAREVLLKTSNWETWVHPWFRTQGRKTYYPVGLTAMLHGISYDLLAPFLTGEERRRIRTGILEKGVRNAFEEYFVDNRIPNHTSNWISHCTAGPLTALLAFYGEEEVEPYFSGLAEKFLALCRATFQPDGSYGEGYGYQNFTLESAVPFLAALENRFGVIGLVDFLNISSSYLFPLYISSENGTHLLDMGDSTDHRGPASNWAWLAARGNDPFLKYFYNRVPGTGWQDFLWFVDEDSGESPESLPRSRWFPNKGNVVFRTGWGNEDAVLVFHAGPHFNHNHLDQGTFRLRAFGEDLITEAGKSGYYTDPYYWSHFIQSGGHNTVLVDDRTESQETADFDNEVLAFKNRAFIDKVFLGEPFSRVTAHLEGVYRGELESFERNLYFIDPGYVIVRDRIRSKGDPHTFTWQVYPPRREGVRLHPGGAVYEGEKASLHLYSFHSARETVRLVDRPIPINEYESYPRKPLVPRAVIQLRTPRPVPETEFLVALVPERRDGRSHIEVTNVREEKVYGFQIILDRHLDRLLFRTEVPSFDEPIKTDATALFTRSLQERVVAVAAERARELRVVEEPSLFFRSESSIDALWRRTEAGESWLCKGTKGSRRVRLELGFGSRGTPVLSGNGTILAHTDTALVLEVTGEVLIRWKKENR